MGARLTKKRRRNWIIREIETRLLVPYAIQNQENARSLATDAFTPEGVVVDGSTPTNATSKLMDCKDALKSMEQDAGDSRPARTSEKVAE